MLQHACNSHRRARIPHGHISQMQGTPSDESPSENGNMQSTLAVSGNQTSASELQWSIVMINAGLDAGRHCHCHCHCRKTAMHSSMASPASLRCHSATKQKNPKLQSIHNPTHKVHLPYHTTSVLQSSQESEITCLSLRNRLSCFRPCSWPSTLSILISHTAEQAH